MREFGVKLSVVAAPLREASLAAKRGFAVGFCCRDRSAFTSLKRYVSRDSMRVPPARSHLKRFCLKIVLSFGCGAHVFSRPRFLSSGSGLERLELKSLRFCSTFCVYFSKIAVNTDSKSKLCAPKGVFGLLAAVL